MTKEFKQLKYEYILKYWGGFFNDHNIEVHGEPDLEYQWFDDEEDREAEKMRLKKLAKKHSHYLTERGLFNDSIIVFAESEGFLTRYRQVIEAKVSYNARIYHIENDLGYGFFSDEELGTFGEGANYFKEYKYDIYGDLPDDHELLFSTIVLRP